jgi:hypothetical protein
MNQLDATASPINIFRNEADLRPYRALLPDVSLDNLMNSLPRDTATAYWIQRTAEQDLTHADMADPFVLNQIIWFSVRPDTPMPAISRLPAFDAMKLGVTEEEEEEEREREVEKKRKRVRDD